MLDARNVLVFPCGSEIGLEIRRALRYCRHVRLIGASSIRDHGDFVYPDAVEPLPWVTAPDFPSAFDAVLRSRRIEYVFPAHDEVLVRLAERAAEAGFAAEILAPEAGVCRLCRSKRATYAFFADKIPTPRQYRAEELASAVFPLFMKPDAGQGSRGAAKVDGADVAVERLRRSPTDLLMEFLPGHEYTVDCFTDRLGRLAYCAGRTRARVANGISVNSRDFPDMRFRRLAEIINRHLPLRGAWFFQLKEDAAGEAKLLEIAPRIAGTSGFRRALGVNLPLLSLYDRMGLDVEVVENRLAGVEVDRALGAVYRLPFDYRTVYVDLDDTLILGDAVNGEAVRFLYQCLNRGKRLVLLTRHAADPESTLRRFRLDRLFDQVIWLRNGEPKSAAIGDGKEAILLDDSFAERREAAAALGIPVFDPAALECLIDP
ncbi:MAG: ATP-grasp domain-containing protein [Planctomycetota bacterium]|jgi:hypothetical protein|nr:ATP-grasp domain-containing protein [Planctomycetota bacterium]